MVDGTPVWRNSKKRQQEAKQCTDVEGEATKGIQKSISLSLHYIENISPFYFVFRPLYSLFFRPGNEAIRFINALFKATKLNLQKEYFYFDKTRHSVVYHCLYWFGLCVLLCDFCVFKWLVWIHKSLTVPKLTNQLKQL